MENKPLTPAERRERARKLEVIRQAAIPYRNEIMKREYTPLQCVERVWSVEVLAETPTNKRIPVRVDLDVHGVGRWQSEISIFIPPTLG